MTSHPFIQRHFLELIMSLYYRQTKKTKENLQEVVTCKECYEECGEKKRNVALEENYTELCSVNLAVMFILSQTNFLSSVSQFLGTPYTCIHPSICVCEWLSSYLSVRQKHKVFPKKIKIHERITLLLNIYIPKICTEYILLCHSRAYCTNGEQ